MKNIKRLIAASLIALFTLSSCDYTDLEPTDMVNPEKAFENVDNLHKVVVGLYGRISLKNKLKVAEYIADDCQQGGDSGGAGTDLTNWVYVATSNDASGLWAHYYSVINEANRILYFGPNVKALTEEEEASKRESLGTAYFFRAYAHFELLCFFSDFTKEDAKGIPYVSHYHVTGKPARNTVGECYAAIMSDLGEAYDMLRVEAPDLTASNNAKNSTAYISKAAVDALRARVSIYRKRYVHANIYAENAYKAIGGKVAELNEVEGLWQDKNNAGVIFKLSRPAGSAAIGGLFVGQDYSSIFLPTNELLSKFNVKDVRAKSFVQQGHDRGGNPVWMVTKWFGDLADIGREDEKMFRAEEMYFIMMECLIHQGQSVKAAKMLNDFRAKRIEGYTQQAFSNLEKELVEERRRELVWEGHRLFDVRRFELKLQRKGRSLNYDDYRMILPIPQAEIDANDGISQEDQNYGY